MTGSPSARTIAGVALASCAVAALITYLIVTWPTVEPLKPTQQQAQPLPPAVPDAPKIDVPGTKAPDKPPIKAQEKTPELRKRTKLPPAMFDAKDTYIMATGALQSEDDRSYTLSSVLDRRTGETQVYAVADPLPLLARENKRAIGIGYGIREDGQQVGIIHARWDVIRAKQIHAGVHALADTEGRAAAWINVEWRF